MKYILCIVSFSLFGLLLNAQTPDFEVEGKMLVKDINGIATFQSTVKNSFINFATNDDPLRSTRVGYFDDNPDDDDNKRPYFFIDTPEPGFGEFIMLDNGNVGLGTLDPRAKLNVVSTLGNIDGINIASSGDFAHGIFSKATGTEGIGVWGNSTNEEGAGVFGSGSGIGVAARGEVCDFDARGPGANYCSTSSIRWKSNIKNITDPITTLSKLRGVTFTWDKEHGGHHDIGFIAEEVGKILPEVVVYEANEVDASGMDYSQMTPLLVEAANAMREEYQDRFEEQQSEINILKQEMAELKMLLQSQMNTQSEE